MHPHITWLNNTGKSIKTRDSKDVEVWELKVNLSNNLIMTAWAKHFREQYCLDSLIDSFREGTGLSRADYLNQFVFPDRTDGFGPAIRAGDFAEILLSDFIEDQLGYWVPRTRYSFKTVRNESSKGTDVIGIKFENSELAPSLNDILITFEAKAQFSGDKPKARLQDAVEGSSIDAFRKSESLNAMKQRLILSMEKEKAKKVQRFQDPLGNPYKEISGAAAFFCKSVFNRRNISGTTDCSSHPNAANLILLVIHSKDFMDLVHALYERAANEA